MNNELTAALLTIEKCRELSGCPAGVDLQDRVKQLAAENAFILQLMHEQAGCFNSALIEGFQELVMESGSEGLIDVYQRRLQPAIQCVPPTPATDRIVAGIKADGVEMFALMFAEEAIKDNNITTGWKARASRAASEYAELLREGADK
ncbi:hypothetical protein [Klebsiella aerogenes]|uniref:hypothetical protein n=1 Tax=Klebsiella aerogenes TaxID=548 RepID=UPI0039783D6C|nr:hypothetical protein [Klebsiella aerogenes]